MEIIMIIFFCLGLLSCLGMIGAMIADKPEWVDPLFFLTLMSEGAALVIAVVMVFLNL